MCTSGKESKLDRMGFIKSVKKREGHLTVLHNMITILEKERNLAAYCMKCRQDDVLDASELAEVSTCLSSCSSACDLLSTFFGCCSTFRDTAFPFGFFVLILSCTAGRVSSQLESVNTSHVNGPIHTLQFIIAWGVKAH